MEFTSLELELSKINYIKVDDIVVKDNNITGIKNVILNNDMANLDYLNKCYKLNSTITTLSINSDENYTYTSNELINTYIIRNSNNIVYDTFPTSDDIIKNLTCSTFLFYIKNNNSSNTNNIIILNNISFNIITTLNNIVIHPQSTGIFNCILNGIVIDIYYSNNIYGNIDYIGNVPLILSPIKTYQLLHSYVNIYETNSTSIPLIQNVILNVDATDNIVITLPKAIDIIKVVGELYEGVCFTFIIKLTSFTSKLPLLYTFDMLAPVDSSVLLDVDSLFSVEFSELDWKYLLYKCIYTNNNFICYCINFYNI